MEALERGCGQGIGVGQLGFQPRMGDVFARDQAELVAGCQFRAEHFGKGSGEPLIFTAGRQVAKTEHGD